MGVLTFQKYRNQWIGEVIRNHSFEPIERQCAVILIVDHACAGTGMTFAPVELIAKKAEVSKAVVERALHRLQEEGMMREVGTVGPAHEKCYAL